MANCAHMVFVAVGKEDALDFVQLIHQIVVIGDNIINAEHVVFGEHNTRINDEDMVLIFDGGHVLADFATPAKGNDA